MAADSFTALLGLLKQGTGNNNNTWGALLNSGDFDEVDLAIAGRNAFATTGGTTDLSASPPPAGPSGAIHAILDVTGTLVSNAIIQVPNLSKHWIVRNGTSGAFTLTMKTPSGSASLALPQGGWSVIWCDGNNVIYTGLSTTLRDTQALFPDGASDSAPGIAFTSEANTGFRRKGTNDLVLVIGGVEIMEFTGAGAGSPDIVNVLSPAVLQNQGGSLVSGPGSSVTGNFVTFADATGRLLADSGTRLITSNQLAQGAAPLPAVFQQTADNLVILNDGTNATRDINVTTGRVRSDADNANIQINATLIKRLDTSFASGTNAGACDSGSKGASQTWHIFVIGKLGVVPTTYERTTNVAKLTFGSAHNIGAGATVRVINVAAGYDGLFTISAVTSTTVSYASTGANLAATAVPAAATADFFDVLASQSYGSPTMPSGWTVKQCLGSVMTDGSANIRAFLQVGDEFSWTTSQDNSLTPGTTARVSASLTVPSGVRVLAHFSTYLSNIAETILFTRLDQTDTAPASTGQGLNMTTGSTGTAAFSAGDFTVLTNTSGQIGLRDNIGGLVGIFTRGWRDPRRRLF